MPKGDEPALLREPRLIERIGDTMRAGGYAGDLRPPLIAYVALTSRLLDRPMNLGYIAQSAAGKNRTIEAALTLMPPEAFFALSAGSPRALIYEDENFEHRTIVLWEADSLPTEGSAASAIRSLAADNTMKYGVVERDPVTHQNRTRHVVKQGPTGLLTTSTRSLPPELRTRMLEIPLADDPEQTRAIMRATARAATGTSAQQPDLAPLLELQEWLAAFGAREVVMPFAGILAEMVPSHTVRMNRDFKQLIIAVQAVALLRQCLRSRDDNGRVVAMIEDYATARTLLAPVFDSLNSEGLTDAIRQTVLAVPTSGDVSEAELVSRLRLSKSTVSVRVQRACVGGWLLNLEPRRGFPARVTRGAPLPDATTCLPTPEVVMEAFECSSRSGGDMPAGQRRTGPRIVRIIRK